eukprot:TRINITY_DN1553_c0_g1_i2.p1 TRINITY_DN1553_c0_g1~~TRINITY_DN1553_c0_g1_i2.p1  ORF type:complete len:127 (+),score=2.89 TRINITY_DN1553_c0_g1_i2:60-440(+)
MKRRPPRSTLSSSSAASDVYKRQDLLLLLLLTCCCVPYALCLGIQIHVGRGWFPELSATGLLRISSARRPLYSDQTLQPNLRTLSTARSAWLPWPAPTWPELPSTPPEPSYELAFSLLLDKRPKRP